MATTVHKATVTLGDERVVEITLWPSAGDSMSEFSGRDAIELSIKTGLLTEGVQSFTFDVHDTVAISNAIGVVLDVALNA